MNKFECGNIVLGTITGITKYGVFVKLEDEYTGMIHISEISEKYINDLQKIYVLDEIVEAKILEVDNKRKQLKLSVKNIDLNKKSIKEMGNGFTPLKENLDFWVREKLEELKKCSKTP